MTRSSFDKTATPQGLAVDHPSEHEEHIVGLKVYFLVFLALLAGTGLTTLAAFWEGSVFGLFHLPMSIFSPVIALAIATTKATLVVLFFMHVKYSAKTTTLTVVSAIFFFGILIVLSMSDYISRSWPSW